MVYNQKRKSYTIKHKLSVVKDFEKSYLNGDAKSKVKVSRKYDISTKMLRDWIDQKESFIAILNDCSQSIVQKKKDRHSRRHNAP